MNEPKGTFYTNIHGKRVYRKDKRKYTRKIDFTFMDMFEKYLREAVQNKHKPISAYFKAIEWAKDANVGISEKDFKNVALLLGYKEFWAVCKFKEYTDGQ